MWGRGTHPLPRRGAGTQPRTTGDALDWKERGIVQFIEKVGGGDWRGAEGRCFSGGGRCPLALFD